MSDSNLFHGPNGGYAQELYQRFLEDPDSVDATTRALFESSPQSFEAAPAAQPVSANGSTSAPLDVALAAVRLARYIRQRGHLGANIDPLGLTVLRDPGLDLGENGLTNEALAMLPARVIGGSITEGAANGLDAIARLRQAYSGAAGYEFEHIQDPQERYWLRDTAECRRFFKEVDAAAKRDLLQRLTEVDVFEDFIHKTFKGEKRFSIEGTDVLVPMLDELVRQAAEAHALEVVMGMAHRGRLNVLAHVLEKPYATIFNDFKKSIDSGTGAPIPTDGSQGDVKYHMGYRRIVQGPDGAAMTVTLVPNPSHLEFVNAVAEGQARAAQERCDQPGAPTHDLKAALPILIHGDAAFPGQGIVAETLNLSNLPGYRTGGTIHIIANNQIGFTTLPGDSRSTLYASDLAKGFEIPIVHVNADDPVACIAAARMAYAYREEFGKDFLIDLIGYRRYGHNEGDEPRTTQPLMYAAIDKHPRPRELWARELEAQGIVSRDEAAAMVAEVREKLRAAYESKLADETHAETDGHAHRTASDITATGVSAEALTAMNEALLARPEGFMLNQDAERKFYQPRREALQQPEGIFWAHAEALAFASILADGVPIRLSGQDSERGTFDQRRQVLYDVETGERYVPLQHLPQARAAFAVYNSPLSENAAVGFEYGYSIHTANALVLWEAQFGDFANGAQVIIDQFIASGHAKWRQAPSLVLLLPHGYEGMGPEHSSARLERFLQLAAAGNLRVVNCTTAAQYFHLLRRQAALLHTDPRPLIVMTPKSLLRDRNAASSLNELAQGRFQPVIDDSQARERADQITRLVLCSGKIYINLLHAGATTALREAFVQSERVAVARVEELYPLPENDLRDVISGYPNLREIVWLQEEPRNMGAWSFISPRLRELTEQIGWHGDIYYVGRAEAASPAEGSRPRHLAEQERIVTAALAAAPALPATPRARVPVPTAQ